ncbi:MAG TPA: GGDEF domain-containing protein [Arthrobacter sp.]|nr:GGDEF domain-containing protein [Arthrobacter sp.]
MGLDPASMEVMLGVAALILCLLFFDSYRRSRAPYSGWWCLAIAFLLAGNLAYLLDGTPSQVWAGPLGNASLVAGAFSVWAGSRSLRLLPAPSWQLWAAPAATALAAALENPGTNIWAGGLMYLALMSTGMGLAAIDLWRMKSSSSRTRSSLALAAAGLGGYFFCRDVAYLFEGPGGTALRTYLSPATTSLVTLVLLVIASFSMVSLSNEQLIRALNERATRDSLTGLLNRQAFMDLADRELTRIRATETVSTVILADLDHFKALNDSHGHAAGDAALQAFAGACRASVRRTDFVGRYGGEEFLILLPGAGPESAKAVASEISRRMALAEPSEGVHYPTASYGIAASSAADSTDLAGMIAAADNALYEAKSRGRNQAVCADTPMLETPTAS